MEEIIFLEYLLPDLPSRSLRCRATQLKGYGNIDQLQIHNKAYIVQITRTLDVFFDLRLNERLSKQSRHRWFETPSRPLWRHCNALPSVNRVHNSCGRINMISIKHKDNQWSGERNCCWNIILTLKKITRYVWNDFYIYTYMANIVELLNGNRQWVNIGSRLFNARLTRCSPWMPVKAWVKLDW